MPNRTLRSRIARLGLLAASLLAFAMPAQAAGRPPAIVGFWMGESVVSPKKKDDPDHAASYYQAADRRVLTPEVWSVLQQHRIPLYLHLRHGRDFGAIKPGAQSDAIELVRKANALDIPVIAWIVIPYEQGYWAYEGNAQENFDAVKAWAAWRKANGLKFVSVALDQEFSWQNLRTYVAAVTSPDRDKALGEWMRGNVDPARQCQALRTYGEMISWAHREGIAIDAAEAPMIADDLADGNVALQDGLEMAGTTPGYDRLYLMAYRGAVAQMGADPGPAYAATYFADMQKYFGAAGQVSLGIPGDGPYADLKTMTDDVRMLIGMGAKQIPIFSLEAMVTHFGAEGLKSLAEAEKRPMTAAEIAVFAKPNAASQATFATPRAQDAAATALTLAVTKQRGREQQPNAWPGGCDIPPVAPLAKGAR